jgi:hypothetical protein
MGRGLNPHVNQAAFKLEVGATGWSDRRPPAGPGHLKLIEKKGCVPAVFRPA